MINMECVCDGPDIFKGSWGDKVVVKGQGKNAKIVSFPQEL